MHMVEQQSELEVTGGRRGFLFHHRDAQHVVRHAKTGE